MLKSTFKSVFARIYVHLCIFCTVYPMQGHGQLGDHPRGLGEQGGGHPGQDANPSQGTIATDVHSHTTDVFGLVEENPEYPEETHEARGVSVIVKRPRFEPPTLEM